MTSVEAEYDRKRIDARQSRREQEVFGLMLLADPYIFHLFWIILFLLGRGVGVLGCGLAIVFGCVGVCGHRGILLKCGLVR